jgi:3-oxoacyl-[acyl-carrier protein] reductase
MNKRAIITGGSSGIGSSIARNLAEENIEVILLGRNTKVLENICSEIGEKRANFYYLDFEDIDSITGVYKNIRQRHGTIDILVNSAGIGGFGPIIDLDIKNLQKTMNVNLVSTICLTKEVVKDMIPEKKGQIINIESIAATKGFEYGAAYVSSKFGLAGFSQVLWSELKKYEIKVCSIRPGLVNTAFFNTFSSNHNLSNALDPKDISYIVNMIINQSEKSNISEVIVRPIKRQAQDLFIEILNEEYKTL